MSKHTPGPWQLRSDRGIEGKSFDGMWKNICDKVRGGSPGEADANTRLIVAAPELLAALRDAILWVDDDDQGAPEMKAKWRAVISKAEGL